MEQVRSKVLLVLILVLFLTACALFTEGGTPAPTPAIRYRIIVDDVEYSCKGYSVRCATNTKTCVLLTDCIGYLGDQIYVNNYTTLSVREIE